MAPPRLIHIILGITPRHNPRQPSCFRISRICLAKTVIEKMEIVEESMIRVLMTSSGVVRHAAVPPAMDP